MSRGIKTLWIVIGCLFAMGIVLAAVGFALGATGSAWFDRRGLHFGVQDALPYEASDLDSEAFENINIELIEADVELVVGTGYGYEFSYLGSAEPIVEVSNGTLRVVENDDGWRVNIMGFWSMWNHQQAKLTVYVPGDAALSNVKLATVSGDTYLGGESVPIKSLTCQSASGNVSMGDLDLERLDLEVASGDVRLDSVTAKEANINIISGRFDFDQGSLDNLVMDMASGDVWFKGTVTSSLALRMISGNADLELTGSEDDYSFGINRINGEVHINGRSAGDSYLPESTSIGAASEDKAHIQIDTTSGSVNIIFTD